MTAVGYTVKLVSFMAALPYVYVVKVKNVYCLPENIFIVAVKLKTSDLEFQPEICYTVENVFTECLVDIP